MKQKTPTRKELEEDVDYYKYNLKIATIFCITFLALWIITFGIGLYKTETLRKELTQCQADKEITVYGGILKVGNSAYSYDGESWYQNGTRLIDKSKEYGFWVKFPERNITITNLTFCLTASNEGLKWENCEVAK